MEQILSTSLLLVCDEMSKAPAQKLGVQQPVVAQQN
jgi:hypothetical protein